ncbi:MAG: hypothetical protein JSS82_07050 [Bacteroidetes bacterium]|nr:hypothetical protein [Bacteroidota bacterium]
MQTVTVEINDMAALKALQNMAKKRSIRIVERMESDSPSLPGKPLSIAQFKAWIHDSERSPGISLKDAKSQWQGKRKQLLK